MILYKLKFLLQIFCGTFFVVSTLRLKLLEDYCQVELYWKIKDSYNLRIYFAIKGKLSPKHRYNA